MPKSRFNPRQLWALALAGALPHAALAQEPVQPEEASGQASAEAPEYRLDDRAGWQSEDGDAPAPGSQGAQIREIRALLADDDANGALTRLNAFIERAEIEGSKYMDEALLLRGDAKVARDEEFEALYDYERLIRSYPESEHFVTAIDRETRIAEMYFNGLKLRIFGIRLVDGEDIALELLIRAHERLPDSAIAERASIRIADYYYQKREMRLASDAYEVYLINHPTGPNRIHAERRLIYADMARFKGPRYDGSALQDVRLRIREFAERYPSEAAASGINEGLVARIDESTAAQLLDSAQWYLDDDDDAAARYTLRRMLRAHPDTIAAQRGRDIMNTKGWLLPEVPARPADPDAVRIEGPLSDEIERLDTPEQNDNQDAQP